MFSRPPFPLIFPRQAARLSVAGLSFAALLAVLLTGFCDGQDKLADERIRIEFSQGKRFGLMVKDDAGKFQMITGFRGGQTNRVHLRIDRKTVVEFGSPAGRWLFLDKDPGDKFGKALFKGGPMNDIYVDESTWEYQKSIRVRQSVWLSRADEDASKRDACTVTYSVEELGNFGEEVELRVVIDTRIGNNNGCSFLLSPGQKPIRVADLRDQDVPRKLLALENADATGLLARLQLPSPHESPNAQQPPNRLTITSYGEIGRDWDVKATETEKDTAIVMYWGPRRLARNGDRLVAGYSYGKGQLADLKSP